MTEADWTGATEIGVGKVTGVNDLFQATGNAGGLTPLLNRDGSPVITTVIEEED